MSLTRRKILTTSLLSPLILFLAPVLKAFGSQTKMPDWFPEIVPPTPPVDAYVVHFPEARDITVPAADFFPGMAFSFEDRAGRRHNCYFRSIIRNSSRELSILYQDSAAPDSGDYDRYARVSERHYTCVGPVDTSVSPSSPPVYRAQYVDSA